MQKFFVQPCGVSFCVWGTSLQISGTPRIMPTILWYWPTNFILQILFWCPERRWGWNSMNVLNCLISIPMTYPVIHHSVIFAVSFGSNVLSITKPNYIVRWKSEHKHVIGITIDHSIGKITLNSSESSSHQKVYLLHVIAAPIVGMEQSQHVHREPPYSSLVCQEHFPMLSRLAGFQFKGFWSLCW